MTVNTIYGTVKNSAIYSNKVEQMNLNQGDVINGRIMSLSDTALSVAKQNSDEVLSLDLFQELDLSIDDFVKIEVMKSDVNSLEVSITKMNENKPSAMSHNPVTDSVNFDEVKKSIVDSGSPLKYSSELTNHINHAKSQVESMIENFSDQEIQELIRQGFDPTKMTVELLYQVGHSNRLDKMVHLGDDEDRSLEISVNEEKISQLIKEISNEHILSTADQTMIKALAQELEANDLPVSPKNVENLVKFREKVEQVQEMSSDDLVKFLTSNKKSTIGELYKSLYISQGKVKSDVISENIYQAIEADVDKIMEQTYIEINETLTEDNQPGNGSKGESNYSLDELKQMGKTLVLKGVPLDERAIDTIKYMSIPSSSEDSIHMAISQLKQQMKPEDLEVTTQVETSKLMTKEDYQELKQLMDKIEPVHIEKVVLDNKSVTFRELEYAVEHMDESLATGKTGEKSQAVANESLTASITVAENTEDLQVIRYQMTFKAAMRLSIAGMDIKNTNLSAIREKVESISLEHVDTSIPVKTSQESVGQKSLSQANLTDSQQAVLEVQRHMAVISNASDSLIGEVALQQENYTIRSVSEAAMTYDSQRTQVRTDLGDQIEKAFTNIDDILADLKLEPTPSNQRAVEILGRNEMPITVENINQVKELDVSLQQLFNKMMPEHVKELVSNNIDVINEPIENLIRFVNEKNAEVQVDPNEQIAKQILSMMKNGSLSEDEKTSMIGFYRMVHTIESSKGAALGFMVENDMDVTLENLFDVAKVIGTSKSDSPVMEVSIDDSFGHLQGMASEDMTIKEQIKSGYFDKAESLDQLLNSGKPLKLESLMNTMNMGEGASHDDGKEYQSDADTNQSVSEIRNALEHLSKIDQGILKDGMSLDSLSVNDWKVIENMESNSSSFKDVMTEFSQLADMDSSFKDSFFQSVDDYMNNMTKDGLENFESDMKELAEEIKNQTVENMLDQAEEDLDDSSGAKSQLKMMGSESEKSPFQVAKDIESHMNINKSLAEQEDYYTIPMMINGEIQQMNMYYFRQNTADTDNDDSMSVYFSFTTKNMGTTNMKVDLRDDRSSITMYATEDSGNRQMKAYENEFKELFSQVGFETDSIKYDSFKFPKPINKEEKVAVSKKVKKYQSQFEKMI